MSLKNKIDTALLTDVGRVRKNNEDAIAEDQDIGLLILADGMGGYNAGEVASGIAIATVHDHVRREWSKLRHGEIDVASGYRAEGLLLKKAIETADAAIRQVAKSQPQCAGMGTTIVTCILRESILSIAYVGDSRLYRYREGRLEQITRDHSLLEELIARGHYSREDAVKLVRKNIVTRALGTEEKPQVDVIEETLEIGDILLLCSDGLSDMVNDEDIGLTLGKYADNVKLAGTSLVYQALQNGGRDNVSVVIARVKSSLVSGKGWHWFEQLLEWF